MKVIQRSELMQMYKNKKNKFLDLPILVIGPQKIRHYVKSVEKNKPIVNMIVNYERITYKLQGVSFQYITLQNVISQ